MDNHDLAKRKKDASLILLMSAVVLSPFLLFVGIFATSSSSWLIIMSPVLALLFFGILLRLLPEDLPITQKIVPYAPLLPLVMLGSLVAFFFIPLPYAPWFPLVMVGALVAFFFIRR